MKTVESCHGTSSPGEFRSHPRLPERTFSSDGKFAGQTPSKIPLAAGPHHVEVKFQGRQTWQRDLDVPQGSELTLSAILDPSS